MNDLPTRYQMGKISDLPPGVINRMKFFMELADLPQLTWNLRFGSGVLTRVLQVRLVGDEDTPAENHYFACNADGTLSELPNELPIVASPSLSVQVVKTDFEYIVRSWKKETKGGFLARTTPVYVDESSSYQPSRWVYGNQVASLGPADASTILSANNGFFAQQRLEEGRAFQMFVESGWPPFAPGYLPSNGQLVSTFSPLTKLALRTMADASFIPDTNVSYPRTNDVLYIDREDNPLILHPYTLSFWGTTYDCYDYIGTNIYLSVGGIIVTRHLGSPFNSDDQLVTNAYIYEVNYLPYGDPVPGTERFYAGAKSPWGIASFLNSTIRYGGRDFIDLDISSTIIPVNEVLNERFASSNRAIEFYFLESGGN